MHTNVSRCANMHRFAMTDGEKHTEIRTNASRARASAQRNLI